MNNFERDEKMGTHGESSREHKFELMRLHPEEGMSIRALSEAYGGDTDAVRTVTAESL